MLSLVTLCFLSPTVSRTTGNAPCNLCSLMLWRREHSGQLADERCLRNGWGASAIDAFSTALIMGKTDVVSQILDFVPEIDFSTSYNDTVVSVFETTIRYLGGLLSGTYSQLLIYIYIYISQKSGVSVETSVSTLLTDCPSLRSPHGPTGFRIRQLYCQSRRRPCPGQEPRRHPQVCL